MNDSCCQPENVNDLNNRFDQAKAEEAAKDYADEGLNARGEKLIAYLDTETPGFASVLDIGCGVGAVHQEMLLRGLVRKAVGVDASSASLENAAKNSDAQALSKKTQYIEGDFALQPDIAELGPQPFAHRPPFDSEIPLFGLTADMGKAQEVESLRLAQAPLPAIGRSKATELSQAGLRRVQLQAERCESLA